MNKCRRMILELNIPSFTETNSKYIKNLNLKFEMLKLLKENIGDTLYDIYIGQGFLKRASFAQ